MGSKVGPKTVTQRGHSKTLKFCIDAANSRSYSGEPTTNMQTGGGGSGGGNFSSGSTSGWDFDAKTSGTFDIYTADTHSGSYCARLKNSTSSAIALWKDVTLTNGVTYTFSLWAKNISCPTVPYFSSAGTAVSTVSGGSSFTGISGDWQRFHWTFTVTGSTGAFSPYIRTTNHASQGYFLVDDVQIEQKSVPTPFTATSRTAANALENISGANSLGTTLTATSTFETYGQGLFKPTTRNVLATFNPKQGHIGGAYWDFDGTDEYIKTPVGFQVNNVRRKTIAIWVSADGGTTLVGGSTGGNNYKWQWMTLAGNQPMTGSDYGTRYYWASVPTDGAWYHVVDVVDEDQGTGNRVRRYLNGVLQSIAYTSSDTGDSFYDGTDLYLYIGAFEYGSGATQFLNGRVANCMIWGEALTAKEVNDMYIAQKGRFGK